jgi:hypothetical protein
VVIKTSRVLGKLQNSIWGNACWRVNQF